MVSFWSTQLALLRIEDLPLPDQQVDELRGRPRELGAGSDQDRALSLAARDLAGATALEERVELVLRHLEQLGYVDSHVALPSTALGSRPQANLPLPRAVGQRRGCHVDSVRGEWLHRSSRESRRFLPVSPRRRVAKSGAVATPSVRKERRMPGSPFSSLFDGFAEMLDRQVGWSRLPLPVAMLTLIGLRDRLREQNLHDTGRGALDRPDVSAHERYRTARTLDGSFNDLNDPLMGSLGSRFGRNVPLRYTSAEPTDALLAPNPPLISRELLTRDEFQPATTLNLLAGAWIQFEVHDWFSHGKNEPEEPWQVEVADRDPAFADAVRTHEEGKLRIDDTGLPPADLEQHVDFTGVAGNFWVGLALLHSLFMREHNAICDHLHSAHPKLDDQDLYDKARL